MTLDELRALEADVLTSDPCEGVYLPDAEKLLAEIHRLRGRLQSIADLTADTSPAVIAEMAREALA